MSVIIPRQNILTLNDPGPVNTCEPYTFSWSSTVQDAALTLYIYNLPDVPVSASPSGTPPLPTQINNGPGPASRRAPPADAFPVKSFSLSMQARSFTWDKVDIPQGTYFLYGSIDSLSLDDTSELFYIYNGNDTSCLTASPSSSGSTPSSTTVSLAPSSATSPSNTPAPLPPPPVPIGASSSNVNIGAIVGAVVGGFAVVSLAILAYFFFVIRRRRRQVNDNTALPASGRGKGQGVGRWKGLGSVDMHDTQGNTPGFITGRSLSSESARKEVMGSEESVVPSSFTHGSSVPVERRTSLSGTRKTARKPVPTYFDSGSLSAPPLSVSAIPSPTLENYPSPISDRKYSASSSTSALPPNDRRRSSSNPKREFKHTYADYPKDPDEVQAEAMVRGLKHKASNGDLMQMKPVHYLMPDMPAEGQPAQK